MAVARVGTSARVAVGVTVGAAGQLPHGPPTARAPGPGGVSLPPIRVLPRLPRCGWLHSRPFARDRPEIPQILPAVKGQKQPGTLATWQRAYKGFASLPTFGRPCQTLAIANLPTSGLLRANGSGSQHRRKANAPAAPVAPLLRAGPWGAPYRTKPAGRRPIRPGSAGAVERPGVAGPDVGNVAKPL